MTKWVRSIAVMACILMTQTTLNAQVTHLSVLEVAPNYGIDSSFISDTTNFMKHLDSREQNFIELASECVDMSSKVQTMMYSLQHDYEKDQGYIWINHKSAITDFAQYEPMLIALQQMSNRLSQQYLKKEQQRIVNAARMAEIMEQEERESRQEGRNIEAENLKKIIVEQHAALTEQCKQTTAKKSIQKERKEIYYTYLNIFNNYDFSLVNATEEYIRQLDDLQRMQRHMLDSVVNDNGSFSQQIENFPARLKDSCGLRHNDVYRSYSRVFYRTQVPIGFTTISEYQRYVQKLRDIVYTQNQYLKVIELRDSIRNNTDTMHARYWKKYKNIIAAYDEANASINIIPSFTTIAGSIQFVADLRDYLDVQKLYHNNFLRLDNINLLADSISNLAKEYKMNDIRNAYRKLPRAETFIPHFATLSEAVSYDSTLDDFEQLQTNYMKILALRKSIQSRNEIILDNKSNERVFSNGFKKIRDNYNFTPECNNAEESYAFVTNLQNYIQFQDRCMKTIEKRDTILNNAEAINYYEGLRPNLHKAYKSLMKSYPNPDKITTLEEMEGYDKLQDTIICIQGKFLSAFKSRDAEEIDARIKNMNNTQVKQIFSLTD